MSQLDLFNQDTASYSVDDFNTDPATASPITSMGTNRNVAAHAALLTPKLEDAPKVYNQSFDELNGQGQSQTADALLANAQGETLSGLRTATADLLSDPTKPDEWKKAALDAISNPQSTIFDPRAMAATRAASQPVQGESDESGQLRGLVAGAITDVLKYQREKQKYFNEMQIRQAENPESTEWVNTAESFIPGTLGFKQARMFSSLNDDTKGTIASFFLPGSSKASMAEKFNRLPLDQRQAVMENTLNALAADGQTIFAPAASDQGNLQAFRDIVDEGTYTVTDETVDNLFGVLDMMGIAGWIRGATRGVKAAAGIGEAEGGNRAATQGFPRRPSPQSDWRTGNKGQAGVYDQEGNPSAAVREGNLTPEQSAWQRRFTITSAQPTAPMETIKDVNPTMARNLHQAVEADQSGDLAGALYGTNRTDAIAHDISPQVATPDGRVQSKVSHPERDSDFSFMPDAEVLDFVDNSGASYLSPAEKRVLRANTVNDFQNATGLVPRKEMLSVEDLPDGLSLKGVYGPTDSGWSNISDAVQQAKFAMRKYGISEDNITILHRAADEYIPVDKSVQKNLMESGVEAPGDYLLQINHTHKFNIGDMADEGWEAFDVKNNILDEWAKGTGRGAQGSAASNLLDPQSMLHPNLTKGATVSVGRGTQLEVRMGKLIENYARSVKILKKEEQQRLFEQIRNNNVKGRDFNYADMVADGFSENAIKAAEQWKRAQDTMYELTNRDLVKTYRARGYGVMADEKSGTRLFVKEQSLNQIPDNVTVYDPVKGITRPMTKEEVSAHYATGGNLAKLHDFITVDGKVVEHVLNTNKATGTYVRALKDTDHVLSYRKGYYAVRYDNPHFIEKKVLDEKGNPVLGADGRPMWKVVATADTVPNAIRGRKRLAATHGGNWETDYRHRSDLKGDSYDQARIGHLQAGGMSSQRVRGQRLEEALGDNNISDQVNIENPINSLIHSASSVSNRVAMRDWIESAKARFMAQYADQLPKVRGQVKFPASREDIGAPGVSGVRAARDARTTWEYIRSMENGYHNSIDALYKGAVNKMADIVGAKGFGRSESALRALGGAGGPTAQLKQVAFHLLLALNPLRQFLVQSHQMLMLAASFPAYTVSRAVPDLAIMMSMHLAEGRKVKIPEAWFKAWGRDSAWAERTFDALKKSGIADGIKAHELVRASLDSLADGSATAAARRGSSALKTAMLPLTTVAKVSRKIGFDFGEYLSSASSFLAHYDDAVKKGVKMDAAGIEDTFAKSRNYVYNMDRAGAMPYNHNSVSLFTQFMQVPHKAITQLFWNRQLTSKQKFAMTTYMVAMFGPASVGGIVPGFTNAIDSLFQNLFPEDPGMRQALRSGLEGIMLNNLFTELYGDEVKLDYSSLAPLDSYGMLEFIEGLFQTDLMKMAASTPGGSLLFGSNPRVMNLASDLGRMLGMGGAQEENPVTLSNIFMDIAGMSSGFSNAYKASMALEYSKKYGALGGVTDGKVNSFEAVAAAFGIPTLAEEGNRKAMNDMYQSGAQQDADVKRSFANHSRLLTQQGMTADQYDYVIKMMQVEMAMYPDNARAQQVWKQELDKQTSKGDFRIVDQLLKASGFMKKDEFYRVLDNANSLTQEQKDNIKSLADYNFSNRKDQGK